MSKRQRIKQKLLSQAGKFAMVGVLNTLVDVVMVNILTQVFRVEIVLAGILSGTIAMINSLIFNQHFTFKVHHLSKVRILYFFAITAFGIYVIRPLVLQLFTKEWLTPGEIIYDVTSALGLPLSRSFDVNNFALAMAIVAVLGYNFFMYRKFVFVEEKVSE